MGRRYGHRQAQRGHHCADHPCSNDPTIHMSLPPPLGGRALPRSEPPSSTVGTLHGRKVTEWLNFPVLRSRYVFEGLARVQKQEAQERKDLGANHVGDATPDSPSSTRANRLVSHIEDSQRRQRRRERARPRWGFRTGRRPLSAAIRWASDGNSPASECRPPSSAKRVRVWFRRCSRDS